MPYLRRIILLPSYERLQEFYGQILGVEVVGQKERPNTGKI